ncbi:MAG: hypothetical protein ACOY3P_20255 [Planctomycetota bacterium]
MNWTVDLKACRDRVEILPERTQRDIADAFAAAQRVLSGRGYRTAMDDRAEKFVGAISEYIVDSNRDE